MPRAGAPRVLPPFVSAADICRSRAAPLPRRPIGVTAAAAGGAVRYALFVDDYRFRAFLR